MRTRRPVLQACYPDECGGEAVAELLLGDASPSGKLSVRLFPEKRRASALLLQVQAIRPRLL